MHISHHGFQQTLLSFLNVGIIIISKHIESYSEPDGVSAVYMSSKYGPKNTLDAYSIPVTYFYLI